MANANTRPSAKPATRRKAAAKTEDEKVRLAADITKMSAREIAAFRDRFGEFKSGVKYRLANHVLRLMRSPLCDKSTT